MLLSPPVPLPPVLSISSIELAELMVPGVPVSLSKWPDDELKMLSAELLPQGAEGTRKYLQMVNFQEINK